MADNSIALQTQQPNTLGMLGNIANTANAFQAFQSGQIQQQRLGINLQSEVQANQERQAVIQAWQNKDPDLQPDATGIIDQARARARLQQLAPQTWQNYEGQITTSNQNALKTNSLLQSVGADGLKSLGEYLTPLLKANTDGTFSAKKSEVVQGVNEWSNAIGSTTSKRIASQAIGNLSKIDDTNDTAVGKLTHDAVLKGQALAAQLQATTPEVSLPTLGGKVQPVVTASKLSGLPLGSAVGPGFATSLSPQVILDANQQPHFVGGGGGGAGGGGATPWPTTPQVKAQGSAAEDMTTHFAGLNASSQSLPLVTGLTKTIEGLAPSAFTGPGGDKQQYMAGLARVFGVNLTGDAQTDTNLMNKAMAQLNISTPAGTDAARTLVEAGQPNSRMDPAAIKEAAGTIRGQVLMNNAERNFLTTTRYSNKGAGDPGSYQQGRQMFETYGDPRIWQYEDLSKSNPAAARAFINRQTDKAELVQKATALEQMGFFK